MAEYENREQNYAKTLGSLIGAFTTHIVEADTMAKDEAMNRAIKMFNAGNFDISTAVTILDYDEPLEMKMSVPKIIATDLAPIVISEAIMETTMSVSASQESSLSTDTEADVSGEGSGGFGPVKVKVKVHAHTSVKTDQKRSSDYRATCDTKITMTQAPAPEGILRIVDANLLVVDKAMEMNLLIVEAKAGKMTQDAADNTGGGDDGGGGNAQPAPQEETPENDTSEESLDQAA